MNKKKENLLKLTGISLLFASFAVVLGSVQNISFLMSIQVYTVLVAAFFVTRLYGLTRGSDNK